MQQSIKVNKFPKKSASLLILRETEPNKKSLYNYEILLLKRGKNLSFSNVYAFPGGRLDAIDTHISKTLNINKYVLCAIRETFEEVGLLVSNNDFQNKEQLFNKINQAKQHFQQKNFDAQNFQAISQIINPEYRKSEIKEFIRLVTAPFLPSRYDTQFFINVIKKENDFSHLNWRHFLKSGNNENILDYNIIDYCRKESTDYKWLSPADALIEFYEKKIELAIPQRMMLNILSSFQNIDSLQNMLDTKISNPKDKLQENPKSFPYLFAGIQTKQFNPELSEKYPYTLCMPGDELYPLDIVLDQEKEPELLQEIKNKYSGLNLKQYNKSRIHMPQFKKFYEEDFDFEIQQSQNNPFNYLNNYIQLQNILKQQQNIKNGLKNEHSQIFYMSNEDQNKYKDGYQAMQS